MFSLIKTVLQTVLKTVLTILSIPFILSMGIFGIGALICGAVAYLFNRQKTVFENGLKPFIEVENDREI